MNNSLIPPINPNTFNPKVINEETNKTLKRLFKGKINGSFLIKIKSSVIIKLGIQFWNIIISILIAKELLQDAMKLPNMIYVE